MSKKSETEEGKTEFKCPACKEDFKSKEELEEHTFIHDYDEKTNFCHHPGCSAFFDNQRMLITHIKKEHKGKKAFPCKSKLCKTSYHTPGRLAAHMKEYHANELSDSEFDEDDDKTDKTDKKGAKKAKRKRRAKKVPELTPSTQPYRMRIVPAVMSDEQQQKFKDAFPDNPIFECWFKGCHRQFTSEQAIDLHKKYHQK